MSKIRQQPENDEYALVPAGTELVFNLVAVLPGRASSKHTQRAYFRWIDHYLNAVAGFKPGNARMREARMSALPIPILQKTMSAPQFRAWLGILSREGHGKQGINQARAAMVTLASLLSEAGWIDDYTSAAMGNVKAPSAEDGQRPGRWLSLDEVRLLMQASGDIARTEAQYLRNKVVATMLCTMALRRDEIVTATWADLSSQNNKPMLKVHGKGNKVAHIDIPRPVLQALQPWQKAVTVSDNGRPALTSPLIRRIYKGGGISRRGLTVDGIWKIISDSADRAGIGHVAPHDLRRSVAGALHVSGVSIDKISKLLRHSNVAVTERYLSPLPQRNEGAVLMSDMLGLEDLDNTDPLWGDFS